MSNKKEIALVAIDWDLVDLIDSICEFKLIGLIDSSYQAGSFDLPFLGADEDWQKLKNAHPNLKVILSVDGPEIRSRLVKHYGKESIETILSHNAYVSSRATIGEGAVIQRGVTIMPYVSVGNFCKINVNATLHHESSLGDFCTVSPGAQILGRVKVGNFVYIGAGAIIKQRCQIGDGAIIGAGAVVIRDVPPQLTVVGVPAKKIKEKFP